MNTKGIRLLSLLLAVCLLCGCSASSGSDVTDAPAEAAETVREGTTAEKEEAAEGGITDNSLLYEGRDGTDVITMYLTVSGGNADDSTDHTWTEVNTYSAYDYEAWGVDRYKVEGILQIDEGSGITAESFGYGAEVPNVTVQVRGQTSSQLSVKNYKIRIKDGMGSYQGQRTLNLNKHVSDSYRFTNKLSYDLAASVPQLIGCRTTFVHLYVKDDTAGGSGEYEDYGLYTMVEQVNRTYLRSHGLDENGQLYKVTFFEWYDYDVIMADEDSFDRDEFEDYLEIKGSEDSSDLQEVLTALQNYNMPIETIIDRYFDAENLVYWYAFNILIGNYDSSARNYFLYSPSNSDRYYMTLWDLDASFRQTSNELGGRIEGQSWEQGFTMYLGLVLYNRMMRQEEYRDMLDAAIEDLYQNYINEDTVGALAGSYSQVVWPYLYGSNGADAENRRIDEEEYAAAVSQLAGEVTDKYNTYYESKNWPWPFFVDLPEYNNGKLTLSWGASYNIGGESVTYSYCLATDYSFEEVIASGEGLTLPYVQLDEDPGPGTFYLRVIATNESGYSMECFDYYSTHEFGKAYGCYAFTIAADGTIQTTS